PYTITPTLTCTPPCRMTTTPGGMRSCSPSLGTGRGRISPAGSVPASAESACGRRVRRESAATAARGRVPNPDRRLDEYTIGAQVLGSGGPSHPPRREDRDRDRRRLGAVSCRSPALRL